MSNRQQSLAADELSRKPKFTLKAAIERDLHRQGSGCSRSIERPMAGVQDTVDLGTNGQSKLAAAQSGAATTQLEQR